MAIISSTQLTQCKRLLFMSPVALGDFLYLKTFLIALKQQFPHVTIDIWLDDNRCNDDEWRLSRSKILQQWIESEPAFSASYGCTQSKQDQAIQVKQANQQQYDIIICHSGSKSAVFSKLARDISPTAFIISSIAKAPFNGWLNKLIFRHSNIVYQLDVNALPANHHITDRFYQILHDITGLTVSKELFMPQLVLAPKYQNSAQSWLNEKFDGNPNKIILINHLSTNTKRDWQAQQVVELIQKIEQYDPNSRFVINVTKEQVQSAMASIVQALPTEMQSKVAIFTIQNHFFELPAIIDTVDLVITVETAIMHFATAANTPLIALMRSKKPYWAPPTTSTSQVLYATEGKGYVSDISVDSVLEPYQSMC